jgi:hypothetical protein
MNLSEVSKKSMKIGLSVMAEWFPFPVQIDVGGGAWRRRGQQSLEVDQGS